MISPISIVFNFSPKIFVLLFSLYISSKSTAFASPVPSLHLMERSSMESMVEECCVVVPTHAYHKHEKLVPEDDATPGMGPMVRLFKSDVYHQRITRRKCTFREHPKDHSCSQLIGSNICDANYAKQKAIVHDGWIREIWVEDGCKFGRQ